jgi:hypothetical protein
LKNTSGLYISDGHRKGRPTRRDFIQAVFRLADPSVGNATIEDAMKRVIAARGRIARSQKR